MQSNGHNTQPHHLAIIMDGNGRWASDRGLSRSAGHRRGARNLEPLLERAADLGVGVLTLYAFSSDNWQRPKGEVAALMQLFGRYLDSEARRCRERGIRLQIIGRRDRLGTSLLESIVRAERKTRRGRKMLVRVAIDYSSRWAIASAAASLGGGEVSGPSFRRALAKVTHSDPVGDPDLVIRTGGEQRLSDFMLWESAYAELCFSPCLFPDFGAAELERCVEEFRCRHRRFGGVREREAAAASLAGSLASLPRRSTLARADSSV